VTLAILAVGLLAWRPRSGACALIVAAAGAVDLALGASHSSSLGLVAPLAAFLAAALTLAALVERSGLAERAAQVLAARAGGSALVLYGLVCGLCALLTSAVSLDGAVVLMVPLLLSLSTRWRAPLAPLFLGVVAVANAASLALPQGNPTNLVLLERLRISPGAFVSHMLLPGIAAAALCAGALALSERRALGVTLDAPRAPSAPLSRGERHAALALAVAALAAWIAPLVGVAPWWPFSAAVVLALLATRERPRAIVPWRTAAQVGGMLILVSGVGLHLPSERSLGLLGLIALALAVGGAAALANNLPISVCAAVLLGTEASGYAASIGLAVGALATPQGSLATLIAQELAGASAPAIPIRRFLPLAAAAVLLAAVLLSAGL